MKINVEKKYIERKKEDSEIKEIKKKGFNERN
jgi:hypothetical protein